METDKKAPTIVSVKVYDFVLKELEHYKRINEKLINELIKLKRRK